MPGLWPFVIFVVAVFMGLTVVLLALWRKFGLPGFLAGITGYLITLVAAELVSGILLYTYATFTVESGNKDT
jgi:hypothetical protein